MNTISFNLGGKQFKDIPVNNSGWLSPTGNQELIELCQSAPRVRLNSKGVPIIKDDSGVYLYLGASEYRHEDERHAPGSSASGSAAQTTLDALTSALKNAPLDWLQQAPKEVMAFLPELDQRVKKLEALEKLGLTDEQKKAMIALL